MSIHVLSWVLEESPEALGRRLVLLVLADHAKSDGTCAWPAVDTIARQARLSRRAVQSALRALEENGAIRKRGVSQSGTSIYDVVMGAQNPHPGGADRDVGGAQNTTDGGEAASPEPSREPSGEPSTTPSKSSSREHPELSEWLGHHHELTGHVVAKAGTKYREHIATMFAARRHEGYSLADLKLATIGAWHDEYRREHGHYGHESVLRPTKIGALIAKGGARAKADADPLASKTDWSRFDA